MTGGVHHRGQCPIAAAPIPAQATGRLAQTKRSAKGSEGLPAAHLDLEALQSHAVLRTARNVVSADPAETPTHPSSTGLLKRRRIADVVSVAEKGRRGTVMASRAVPEKFASPRVLTLLTSLTLPESTVPA